jgi:hypothetical protein
MGCWDEADLLLGISWEDNLCCSQWLAPPTSPSRSAAQYAHDVAERSFGWSVSCEVAVAARSLSGGGRACHEAGPEAVLGYGAAEGLAGQVA